MQRSRKKRTRKMDFKVVAIPLVILVAIGTFDTCLGHGYLYDPPSRSTMWRWPQFKGRVPENYDDNGLRCAGNKNSIQCGICGDPVRGPRSGRNMAGGIFAKGIISRTYVQGQVIPVQIQITASHRGFFEFHICPNNNTTKPVTEECFERYPLRMSDGLLRYPEGGYARLHTIAIQLPPKLTCSQCVLRWQYTTDNSPGTSWIEKYRGCADVAIVPTHVH